MAQTQRQSQPHTFARDDPDDSFSLELELQKLRSIQRHVPAMNGHGHGQPSLYSDRNRGNGSMANTTILSDLYNSNGTDAQEQARKIRNQMILAKIQEIERNFTSIGLERQRKLDIMRREHEALTRKYRPMELLYKHVGISSTYPRSTEASNTGTGRDPGQYVPELKSTGVNTIITGPVVPAHDSEKNSASRSQPFHDLESKHSSIGRRITFADNTQDNGSIEHQNNINTNPNNNNNNNDWTNDGNTTRNLEQTFAIRDQFNDLESRFIRRQPMSLALENAAPGEESEIKRDQNNAADKLVDKPNNNMDEVRPTQLGYFLEPSTTESEDNTNEFPARALTHPTTANAVVWYIPGPQALALSDDDETSTSFSGPKDKNRKDLEMKAATAAVVNLSSDSSFTTFPTHTNTTPSYDLLAKGGEKKGKVILLGADYGNAGDVADVGGATSLEILDGPGTETVNDADVEADQDAGLQKQVPDGRTGKEKAGDNEDGEDNTQTSAAGESIVMDSQNIKASDSLQRDESELVYTTEPDVEGDQHDVVESEDEEQEQEVKNRTQNVEVINEDRNNRIQDTEDIVRLELEAYNRDKEDGDDEAADEENKDERIYTVFAKEFLPTTFSASDFDASINVQQPIQVESTGFDQRMDEEMNSDNPNDFPIEGSSYVRNMLYSAPVRPKNVSSWEDVNSPMNEIYGIGDGETTSTNEMKLKDDDFSSNESDTDDKVKGKENPNEGTGVHGGGIRRGSIDNKGNRIRLRLNNEDSDSEFSESAAKAMADGKHLDEDETSDREGMEIGAPYTQFPGMTSDTVNFVTDIDVTKMANESDNDNFFD